MFYYCKQAISKNKERPYKEKHWRILSFNGWKLCWHTRYSFSTL